MSIPVLPVLGAGLALALSAATVAAQNSVSLPARDTRLGGQLTNVWTAGTAEGRDWEMFAGIRALAFDRQNNLYILDQQNARVVVVDSAGRYLRQFGKKGQGPGEFTMPLQLAVTTDGNVVVGDIGNRAFIVFSGDGTYLRNVAFGDGVRIAAGAGIHANPNGGIVARANDAFRPDNPDQDTYTRIIREPLGRGEPATSLYRVAMPKPTLTPGASGTVSFMSMDPIFGARPVFGVLPDGGIALSHESTYSIKVLDASGRTLRTLTRNFPPKKVTRNDQEAWQERRRKAEADGAAPATTTISIGGGSPPAGVGAGPGGAGRGMPTRIEDMVWAEYMSVITNLRTDPSGRIWVQRRERDGSDSGPIDLVMQDGRYIGTLPSQPLPDAVSASGLAAYITRDELGVERVVVRRLPATWR